MASQNSFTDHVYQRNAKLLKLHTTLEEVLPFSSLSTASQALFKQGTQQDMAMVTRETIFHPQGGGQPSDTGTMAAGSAVFHVSSARVDTTAPGRVLHFGRFDAGSKSAPFVAGQTVEQAIDADKRLLYSRLHTAGHVLGAVVRHLLEAEVDGFDELKASHFPGSAACEFRGRIEGRWQAPV